MPENPLSDSLSNPGIPPASPTSPYGPDKPRVGAGEETQEPKPFTLPPDEGKAAFKQETAGHPTPMEIASEAAKQQQTRLSPEELRHQLSQLHSKLGAVQQDLQNPTVTKGLTQDHYAALQRAVQASNPDMQDVAKYSKGKFDTPQQKPGQPVLDYVVQWINGSQGVLGGALDFLQNAHNTQGSNVANYLKLQYAVQKASQRGQLFASIIGASVSGIKTIMSTQIG